jgi:hypothetical protein
MAVTAKFVADFSDFYKAVKRAEASLRAFEKTATAAVHPLDAFGVQMVKAGPQMGGFTDQLKTFDSILASAGINIGPAIRALGELGTMAAKGAGSLGLLAQAGTVLAGSFIAFKGVRATFDFLGIADDVDKLSQKFWEQVAAIKGWQSGAAEAASVQDVLARASANAGREITSYGEAIEINKKAAEAQSRAFQASVDPARASREEIVKWQKSIRDISQRGDLQALNQDLRSHNFSLQTLATRYGTTTEALEYYRRKLTDLSAQENKFNDERAEAQKKQAADLRKFYNDIGEMEIKAAADAQAALQKQQADLRAYYNWVGERRMEDEAAAMAAAVKKETEARAHAQALMDAAIAEHNARVAAAQGTNAHTQAVLESHQAISQIPGVVGPAITGIQLLGGAAKTAAQYYQELKGTIDNAAQTASTLANWNAPMGGQLGASNIIQRGRNLYNAQTGEYVAEIEAKYGAGGFLGYGVRGAVGERAVTNVNIYGSVLGNPHDLANAVGGALVGAYRTGGNRLPV